MKAAYYPDTDSLYIGLSEKISTDSMTVAEGVVVDFSEDGAIVGIDIDHASKMVNLSKLESSSLPLQSMSIG